MGKVKEEKRTKNAESTSANRPKEASATTKSSSGSAKGKRQEPSLLSNFWSTDLYKATQGRRMRGFTFAALVGLIALGLWRLSEELASSEPMVRAAVPLALLGGGLWLAFRMIHQARFAEFLIASEAEMNKVSWISWSDLKKATKIVMAAILVLSLYLFAVDWVWTILLKLFGIIGG